MVKLILVLRAVVHNGPWPQYPQSSTSLNGNHLICRSQPQQTNKLIDHIKRKEKKMVINGKEMRMAINGKEKRVAINVKEKRMAVN